MSIYAVDNEKGDIKVPTAYDEISTNHDSSIAEGQIHISQPWWKRHLQTLRSDLTETRGVERVPPERRKPGNFYAYVQMVSLWLSANFTANHVALGLLGPSVYGLSFLDSALCATFGVMVGCACTGYMSAFGPQSGNRTMIIARYSMGWWPSRIVVVLNLVIMIGYGMIDCVVGGQMLSGDTRTIAGNRLSMFALCLSAPSAWAPAGADFYVYFDQKTSKKLTFFLIW